jgi:hypothetical protein
MRVLFVILLNLICVDIAAQNVGASEEQGFQLPSSKSNAEPLIRYQKTQTVWKKLNPEWRLLLATPVSQREPSVPEGTDTSSTIQPGYYFDPYSAYATTNAQVAGEAPPGWTPAQLYMSARPCRLYRRHFCLRASPKIPNE